MKEPEIVGPQGPSQSPGGPVDVRRINPDDLCQYDNPMKFCSLCGTWMNCKRDGVDLEYRRRPEPEAEVGSDMAGSDVSMPGKNYMVDHGDE